MQIQINSKSEKIKKVIGAERKICWMPKIIKEKENELRLNYSVYWRG